jgi:ribosomal-protein-alanine N-acetyltransferase
MTGDVAIRPARPEDVEDLVRLDVEAFGDIAYGRTTFQQLFDISAECCLVADDSSGLLGYALTAITPSRDKGWLLALAVTPNAKGRGIGRRLTQVTVDILRSLEVTAAWLTVEPDNEPAISLYRSMGFMEKEMRADYFGPGEDRLVMALAL